MRRRWTVALLAFVTASLPSFAGPLYVGASYGNATASVETPSIDFKADDDSWKAFAGYRFLKFFGVEGGYVDLGAPEDEGVTIEAKGWDLFGVGVLPLGPVDIFAKVGAVSWDADASGGAGDDSGEDAAYGVGISFSLKKIAFRAEYEYFDVGALDDIYMLSAGVEWRF